MSPQRAGLLHGLLACVIWGGVPAYWKLLGGIDPLELNAHRALWGLLAFAVIAIVAKRGRELRTALRSPRAVGMMAISALLIAINWCVFVIAAMNGYVLEVSLGYFISPLVSIALGTLLLRERLRGLQWIAISLAIFGVATMTWHAGRAPWLALILGFSWGFYSLVRKTARVEVLVGSTIETLLMAPIALGYLAIVGGGDAMRADPGTMALVIGTGVVTAIPLVLFTSAARRLPLTTVGFLGFIAPSGHFLLAVLAYSEPLANERLLAFVWIWAGLGVFAIDLVRSHAMVRT